jgi:hypothetical protein
MTDGPRALIDTRHPREIGGHSRCVCAISLASRPLLRPLYAEPSGAEHGLDASLARDHRGARPQDREAWRSANDSNRRRRRVHNEPSRCLGPPSWHRGRLHSSGRARRNAGGFRLRASVRPESSAGSCPQAPCSLQLGSGRCPSCLPRPPAVWTRRFPARSTTSRRRRSKRCTADASRARSRTSIATRRVTENDGADRLSGGRLGRRRCGTLRLRRVRSVRRQARLRRDRRQPRRQGRRGTWPRTNAARPAEPADRVWSR